MTNSEQKFREGLQNPSLGAEGKTGQFHYFRKSERVRSEKQSEGFELYVLFSGTSNEFNAIPQYGKNFKNTQIFRYPEFSLDKWEFNLGGSDTEPLFYYYYSSMIKSHIYACLSQLGIECTNFKRIVVSGHSMGGGLVITLPT